ncbi:MAG: hypothetical protein JW737_04855 [Acidobacteria bacterium]|nr:hypothetical protein [Acidobacteriota bacterium]
MNIGDIIIVYLQNPKERVWGRLQNINEIGLIIRGLDVNSFEDWARQIARGEEGIGLTTIMFPTYRIEKIIIDEEVGGLPSLKDKFLELVGISIENYLSE